MTPEEGLRLQIEGYRRMTPQQRLQVSFRLYALTRTLVRQGVKHQHPDWSEESRIPGGHELLSAFDPPHCRSHRS